MTIPRPPETRPDTSRFVEHLRLVHFTLTVGCLITMIAITSQQQSSAARAFDQTNQLLQMNDLWHGGQWVRHQIQQARLGVLQRNGGTALEDVALDLDPPPSPIPGVPTFVGVTVQLSDSWALADLTPGPGLVSIGPDFRIPDNDDNPKCECVPPRFDNLGGATKIWERLDRFRFLVVAKKLMGGWYVQDIPSKIQTLTVNPNPASADGHETIRTVLGSPQTLLRKDLIELLKRGPWRYGEARLVTGGPNGQTIDRAAENYSAVLKLVSDDTKAQCYVFVPYPLMVIRAECATEYLSLQSSLTGGMVPTPPLGDFTSSFPDVADLAKNLSALSLTDLRTFFVGEKNRSAETVDFPGLKLPGEAVTSWGIVVLIAILLYFAVTFKELTSRVSKDDVAWDIPWIGTSSDWASRAVFVSSMLFALWTVAYLAWRGALLKSAFASRPLYVTALIVAIVVVAFTLLCWRKIADRQPGPGHRDDA
jgi:hypothetical protein